MSELVNYLGDEHTKYEKKEVEWLLHHSHLPELAATGWIDYEPQENLIHYYGYEKAESALKDVQEIFE